MPHDCDDFGKEWKSRVFYTYQLNALQQDCRVNGGYSPLSPHGRTPGRSTMLLWGDSPAPLSMSTMACWCQFWPPGNGSGFQPSFSTKIVFSSLFPPGLSLSRYYCSGHLTQSSFYHEHASVFKSCIYIKTLPLFPRHRVFSSWQEQAELWGWL